MSNTTPMPPPSPEDAVARCVVGAKNESREGARQVLGGEPLHVVLSADRGDVVEGGGAVEPVLLVRVKARPREIVVGVHAIDCVPFV